MTGKLLLVSTTSLALLILVIIIYVIYKLNSGKTSINRIEEDGASCPITSLGKTTSSTGQRFVLIRPNYLKKPSNREDSKYSIYEDRKYAMKTCSLQ